MFVVNRRDVLSGMLALPFLSSVSLAGSADKSWEFPSIDGGFLSFSDWPNRPILVVNTASRCGFTYQYDALQKLHEDYEKRGLVVLAVPSGDFRQELGSEEEVKHFCEVNFNLTMPMTTITPVLGDAAHPFYKWMKQSHGWAPTWNFNKVLIRPDGVVAGTWRATVDPNAPQITREIEAFL